MLHFFLANPPLRFVTLLIARTSSPSFLNGVLSLSFPLLPQVPMSFAPLRDHLFSFWSWRLSFCCVSGFRSVQTCLLRKLLLLSLKCSRPFPLLFLPLHSFFILLGNVSECANRRVLCDSGSPSSLGCAGRSLCITSLNLPRWLEISPARILVNRSSPWELTFFFDRFRWRKKLRPIVTCLGLRSIPGPIPFFFVTLIFFFFQYGRECRKAKTEVS